MFFQSRKWVGRLNGFAVVLIVFSALSFVISMGISIRSIPFALSLICVGVVASALLFCASSFLNTYLNATEYSIAMQEETLKRLNRIENKTN